MTGQSRDKLLAMIDRGGGQSCNAEGVLKELAAEGLAIIPINRDRSGDANSTRWMFFAAAMSIISVWDAWADDYEAELDAALQSAARHAATLFVDFPTALTDEEKLAFSSAVTVITFDSQAPGENPLNLTFDEALIPLRKFVSEMV